MSDIARCAACGEPVSYTDEGGCVGTDPAYHFRAECLLGAARRADAQLQGAVAALEKIKAEEGKVCDRFELCEHRACNSSYAAWAIADQALRAVREQ